MRNMENTSLALTGLKSRKHALDQATQDSGSVLHSREFGPNDQRNLIDMIRDLTKEFGKPGDAWGFYCTYDTDQRKLHVWFNDPRLSMMYVLKYGNTDLV